MPIDILINFIMSLGALGVIVAFFLAVFYGLILRWNRDAARRRQKKEKDETVHTMAKKD